MFTDPVYVCLVEVRTDPRRINFKDSPRIRLKDSAVKSSGDATKDMIGKIKSFSVDGTYRKAVICESLPEKLRSLKQYQGYPKTGLVSICKAAKVAMAEDVKVQLRSFYVYDDAGKNLITLDCLHSTVYKVGDKIVKWERRRRRGGRRVNTVLSVAHVKHIGLMREVCKAYKHAQSPMPTWNYDSGVIDKQLAAAEQMTIAQM